VPVPLHPYRLATRGFNQADDLASHLGIRVWRLLRRRRLGRPQAGLPAALRRTNVRNAYALRRLPMLDRSHRPRAPARLIEGAVLILVDDVMTTGETMDACAGVLLSAGARSVRAVTVARAVAERRLLSPRTRDLSRLRRR
jgi:predicted amidophosphoribosyltransferase